MKKLTKESSIEEIIDFCNKLYESINQTKTTKFDFKNKLIELGVDPRIASDWMMVRNKKKATNSETAFNNIVLQIEKSGLSANECIKLAAANSWHGFNANWIKNETYTQNNTSGFDNTRFSIKRG